MTSFMPDSWGGYVPQFDDLSSSEIPGDAPTGVPNPRQPYSGWSSTYRSNLLAIPVQAYETLPTGTGCLTPLTKRGRKRCAGGASRGNLRPRRRQPRPADREQALSAVDALRG